MTRTPLTDGSGRWFNLESAEVIKEETRWNGNNHVSRATGDQFHHETLYRTAGKIWILNHSSQWQGSLDTYEEITNDEAAAWLAKQGLEPHQDCEKEYCELEIK